MFDYRYHALSLAAVLFALALGVLIGVAIGDTNLVSSAKNGIVHNLNSEVSEAREKAGELQERFGKLAGRQLVSGGLLVSRELLSRVRGALFSAFDGQLTRLEGLVVLRAQPSDMSPEDSEAATRFEAGLVAGVNAVGVPT